MPLKLGSFKCKNLSCSDCPLFYFNDFFIDNCIVNYVKVYPEKTLFEILDVFNFYSNYSVILAYMYIFHFLDVVVDYDC